MKEDRRNECSCEKSRRRWQALRLLLLLAGLSLALYMPYKAFAQFESLESIYGPWFLQGAAVAVAGLFFTIRPAMMTASPLWLRIGVGIAALLWMRTGLACTPSLLNAIEKSLPSGGFAMFHMLVQHVFLSLGVVGMAAAPAFFAGRMGAESADVDTGATEAEPAASRS